MEGFPKNETEVEIIDKRLVKRITVSNFISNVLDAFNISRGGVYTVKRLLLNPGQLAREYVGVSRYRITPPINILVISTAITLLLLNQLEFFEKALDETLIINHPSQDVIKAEVIQTFGAYFNLLLWIYIPIAALVSYLFNRKRGLNFAENLVFQTYNLCVTNFVFILIFPISYLSLDVTLWLYQIMAMAYMVYGYKVFFGKKWIRSILEAAAVFLIGSFLWTLVIVVVLVIMAVYLA